MSICQDDNCADCMAARNHPERHGYTRDMVGPRPVRSLDRLVIGRPKVKAKRRK